MHTDTHSRMLQKITLTTFTGKHTQAATTPSQLSPSQLAELLCSQACCSFATDASLLLPVVSSLWFSLQGPLPAPPKQPEKPSRERIQPSRSKANKRVGGDSEGSRVADPSEQQDVSVTESTAPTAAAEAVCMGLHALCGLYPCLDAVTQQQVRGLLERMAAEAVEWGTGGMSVSTADASTSRKAAPPSLSPAVLLALTRCCWVFGCTLPSSFAETVIQRGASASDQSGERATSNARDAQQANQLALAAAAGLLLPVMEGCVSGVENAGESTQGVQLVHDLLQRLTQAQPGTQTGTSGVLNSSTAQPSAVSVFLKAAGATGCALSPAVCAALAQAALATQCPVVMAQTLRVLTAGGSAPSECQVRVCACVLCVCVYVRERRFVCSTCVKWMHADAASEGHVSCNDNHHSSQHTHRSSSTP